LRLIKCSLRPDDGLHRGPIGEDDPDALGRGDLTGCGGGGVDIRLPEYVRLTIGLGGPDIEARDFLADRERLVLSLLLAPRRELAGSAGDGPRS
jgi:hypothetical protein